MTDQLILFDYHQLDSETRIVVQQRTTEIKALMKRTAQDIIEIGEKLIEVKARLPHGAFGGWLESEFQWSYPTAAKIMSVANQFKSINFIDLDIAPSALYLLAAPSTPADARAEAIARAEAGERITHKKAKELINGLPPLTPEQEARVAQRVEEEWQRWQEDEKNVTPEQLETAREELFANGTFAKLGVKDNRPPAREDVPPPRPYAPQHSTAAGPPPSPAPVSAPVTPAQIAAALDNVAWAIDMADLSAIEPDASFFRRAAQTLRSYRP